MHIGTHLTACRRPDTMCERTSQRKWENGVEGLEIHSYGGYSKINGKCVLWKRLCMEFKIFDTRTILYLDSFFCDLSKMLLYKCCYV